MKIELEPVVAGIENRLGEREKIAAEIQRIEGLADDLQRLKGELLLDASALDDEGKITALARIDARIALCAPRLDRLRGDLAAFDLETGRAIDDGYNAGCEHLAEIERGRFDKFKSALVPFFTAGLEHRFFRPNPHDAGPASARRTFEATDAFHELFDLRRASGNLRPEFAAGQPAPERARRLLRFFAALPAQ